MHKLTEAARSRCQFIEKIEQKTLAFVTKKSIKKEAEWKLWPKIFFAVYFWEAFNIDIQLVCYHAVFSVVTQRSTWTLPIWKKDFEFVFFSVMVAVSFWVSFTGEIDNLTIYNYKACQTRSTTTKPVKRSY